MGLTLDQYRACIGLFNSFRVIKCRAYFGASFFHYCLKFLMFSILLFFKYFSFSSINSVAAEFNFFTCFIMFYSYCIMQSWYWGQSQAGWVEELLFCLSLEFKQYLGRRLFQTLTNFSLFECLSIWYFLSYGDFFRLFDFGGESETSNLR